MFVKLKYIRSQHVKCSIFGKFVLVLLIQYINSFLNVFWLYALQRTLILSEIDL